MEKIGHFTLHQAGVFIAQVRIEFVNENGELQKTKASSKILNNGKRRYFDPKSYNNKIKDGTVIYLDVIVTGGTDRAAPQPFIYEYGNVINANYRIGGTRFNSTLKLQNVS